MSDRLLSVEGLSVDFNTDRGWANVVRDVSFHVDRGETLALVGESGSGKTVTSTTIMGLLPQPPGRVSAGRVVFDGVDLLQLSRREMEDVRGSRLAMIFQEPMTSLNPAFSIGDQIAETIRRHTGVKRSVAKTRAVEMLQAVHIPRAADRFGSYPHEFSGGMRQRVGIAIALSCNPELLVADEPTTALDVTVQAQILDLLRELRDTRGLSLLFITHDLGVVADICDRVAVMYAGEIIEQGDIVPTFHTPRHPYTEGLLASAPRLDGTEPLRSIPGSTPPPWELPQGCRFSPRCRYITEECTVEHPPVVEVRGSHGQLTRCLRHIDLELRGSNA